MADDAHAIDAIMGRSLPEVHACTWLCTHPSSSSTCKAITPGANDGSLQGQVGPAMYKDKDASDEDYGQAPRPKRKGRRGE